MCFQPARSVPAASPLPPQGPWPPSTAEGNGPHPVLSPAGCLWDCTPPIPCDKLQFSTAGEGAPFPPISISALWHSVSTS